MTVAAALADLPTPCLILDEARMLRNIARLKTHLDGLGVALRPHLKTLKSVEAARRVLKDGNGPATVSTLKEAEVFAAAGVRDIIYAVGIAPQKLPRVIALRGAGCDLAVVLDTRVQAAAVAAMSRAVGDVIPALIEIDCDGHRGMADRDTNRTSLDFGKLAFNARTAAEIFPIMAEAQINRAWAGIEARMPDDIPVIGPSLQAEAAYHAFGFSAHGFQLGPIVGSILAELITTGASNLPIAPFSIGRFAAPVAQAG